MADALRVVLAGCGGICGAWHNYVAKRDDVEMVGLMDLKEEAAEKRKVDFDLPKAEVSTDLASLLKKTAPDAVFDCTIPEAHTEVTLTALEQGCHVLGEKPMTDSMADARRMVKAAEDAGKIYAVIQNRRYLAGIRALRAFLRSGAIGKVTTAQSNFFIGAHFGGFRERMEHVLLLDMAIHTFDAARFILGADGERVYCHEWNPAGSWFDHDASAVAIFEMTDDIVYTYQGSWCAEGCNSSWECDWHIIGEKGSVVWNGGDAFRAETVSAGDGFKRKTEALEVPVPDMGPIPTGHGGVINEFISCVREGGTPDTICTDNIKSLAMVHAAVASADQGAKTDVTI